MIDRRPDRNARFAGRRLYLTGAASGIGRAAAEILTNGGARLALVDVNREGIEAAAAATGGHALPVDLMDGLAIDRSVAEAAQALGGLDGVINCAGITHNARLEDMAPDMWDRVIAVNLTAPYRVCRAALPFLRENDRATIVNVASGMALLPTVPGASLYAASKGGLLSFTKALAAELAPKIRANVLCPGIVNTPMVEKVLGGYDDVDDAPFVAQYALKRVANPRELAEAIAFLTSDEASYVTGAVLAADGGRTFH
jgi:NAD(P)-dependent dehydrogenase (short-subunit alcohol dehydrogenase family)